MATSSLAGTPAILHPPSGIRPEVTEVSLKPTILAAALLCLSPGPDEFREIQWFEGPFSAALEEAGRKRGSVFVYFWMDASDYCVQVWGETITTDAAAAELGEFVCFSANATQPDGAELVKRYRVTTLPTMLVVSSDGSVEEALIGFIPLGAFVSEMQRIKQGTETVSARRAAAEASPDDLDLRLALAMKLDFVGDEPGRDALMESIRRVDPRGRTLAGAQLALYDVKQKIVQAASDPSDPSTLDLTPAYRHLPRVKQETVVFSGWDWVAQIEDSRGDRPKARKAYMAAWPHIQDASVFGWGGEIVRRYWDNRDELTRRDKKFALEVALAAAEKAQALIDSGQAAEQLDDEDRNTVALAFSGLASSYFMNGQRAKALEAIDRSIQIDAENEGYRRLRVQFEK